MGLSFDFFFSFRSPYSYLAVPRIVALCEEYTVAARVRIVLPLAVRDATFFERVNPLYPPYLVRDVMRLADFHGMGFRWPRPDPIVQDFPSRKVAAEQPYIYRVSRLGQAAADRGVGLSFIHEVSQVIWNGQVDGWHEGDHLAQAAARAGADFAELEAAAEHDAAAIDATIADNQAALQQAGHWGVPNFVFEGEPFFGQDRIELLSWRLGQRGLEKRTR